MNGRLRGHGSARHHSVPGDVTEARTVPLAVPIGVRPQTAPRAAGQPPSDHRTVPVRFDLS